MCAGYGGIGLGIKNIFGERLRTIAYCELEGFAQANLISKMEKGLLDAAPIWSDLKTFPYESFHGLVDILIAGYPCQPFSAAGKRAGKEDPRHLWPWIADGIRLLQPRMCFFENVEGHISLGLSTVISDLEELGYAVSWGIFSASEVGAPHQRKRVFIMAYDSLSRSKTWFSEQTNKHEGIARITDNCCDSTTVWRTSEGFICKTCGEEIFTGCNCYHGELQCKKCNEWTYPFYYNLPEDGCQWCGATFDKRDEWPSRPGQAQYGWEPPRVVGNSTDGRWRQCNLEIGSVSQLNEGCADTSEFSETECSLGRNAYEPSLGVDISELSGLSDSELEEIREWMVRCDNRTDELRLLGNGVVPATATRAFLTLLEKLK
jgi:hypothetical protein